MTLKTFRCNYLTSLHWDRRCKALHSHRSSWLVVTGVRGQTDDAVNRVPEVQLGRKQHHCQLAVCVRLIYTIHLIVISSLTPGWRHLVQVRHAATRVRVGRHVDDPQWPWPLAFNLTLARAGPASGSLSLDDESRQVEVRQEVYLYNIMTSPVK